MKLMFLAATATLFLIGPIAALASGGCSPSAEAQARNAVSVAGYNAALEDCLARGKDAGSRAVYAQCADAADHAFGRVAP